MIVKKQKIYLLAGESGYGVFRYWLVRICEILKRQGHEAEVIPVTEEVNIADDEECITMSFNLIRLWRRELSHRKHIIWMVDPPPYHGHFFAHSLTGMPVVEENCRVFCVDAGWVEFAQKVYGYQNICFLPHAASLGTPVPSQKYEKRFDVLFAGSLQNPDSIYAELKTRAGQNWNVIKGMLDSALQSEEGMLGQLMMNAAIQMGLPREKAWVFINVFYPLLDRYMRSRARVDMLKGITDCRVDVFGTGDWDAVSLSSNVIVHAAVPYKELLERMKEARVVLNCAPAHTEGAHERIFDAVMCGAAVVSTPSAYVDETFGDTKAISTDKDWNEAISNMLGADSGLAGEIEKAQALIRATHTLQHRTKEIMANTMYRNA